MAAWRPGIGATHKSSTIETTTRMTPPITNTLAVFSWLCAFAALQPNTTQAARSEEKQRPPNVIVIYTDDQGYGDVGAFGGSGAKTPNLDRMAREGRKFTDFHVAQAVCSASRAALLTGCYPNRIGISGALGPKSTHGIGARELTMAQMFKQKGYATGMAGKWHLGHHPEFLPTRRGFDEYYGIPYSGDMWPYHPEAKPGSYPPLPLLENERILKPGLEPADQEQLTVQYAERAVRFINRHKAEPFFYYLAPNMPHVPLFVSDRFKGKSGTGLFGDVLMEIDWAVGEILQALAANGIDRETLVIFSSDNGPWLSYGNHAGSAGPLREGKGTAFEGGHREPCIMRWPGRIPAGSVCDEPLMTIDLLPTLARLIGAELPKHPIDGLDVWPLISGHPGARNPHDAYYFYYNKNDLEAVRSGDWKLHFPHTARTMEGQPQGSDGLPGKYKPLDVGRELYNLRNDPGETRNLAEAHPEILARLESLAEKARADLGDDLTSRRPTGNRPVGQLQ
jgi:arylsulfatase A